MPYTRVTDIFDDSLAELHNELIDGLEALENAAWNHNYLITPSVTSGNLSVAVKRFDGTNASVNNPIRIRIGNAMREITGALQVTKNAGTNWFNAGGGELATNEVDYFVYLGYNAVDGVTIGFARIPLGKLYSDFSTSATSVKYCAISTITNAAAGDYYINIGRFSATLSAGAGYTWSVPTYTAFNLIQEPVYESRLLTWTPVWTNLTLGNGTLVGRYQIRTLHCWYHVGLLFGSTTSISGSVVRTNPINRSVSYGGAGSPQTSHIRYFDTGSAIYSGSVTLGSTSATLYVLGASGTYANHVALSSTVPFTWTNLDAIEEVGEYLY